MALRKPAKLILCGLMGLITIIGIALLFSYQSPIKDTSLVWQLEYKGESVLILKPRLTEAAYSQNGFYEYYSGNCGKECLSIQLEKGRDDKWGAYNKRLVAFLQFLGYPMMDDSEIHLRLVDDPNFLNQYKSLVLLHNEYVTNEIYQAVTNHANVVYLSPNALYAEVTYENKKMTLIRGHNYPEKEVLNGFGWQDDNSPEEYDLECIIWEYRQVSNGHQLTCIPEIIFPEKPQILLRMKELIQ